MNSVGLLHAPIVDIANAGFALGKQSCRRDRPVEEQEPIEVLSFGGAVIGRAIGRVLNRPEFWIALAVLALAIVFFSIVT